MFDFVFDFLFNINSNFNFIVTFYILLSFIFTKPNKHNKIYCNFKNYKRHNKIIPYKINKDNIYSKECNKQFYIIDDTLKSYNEQIFIAQWQFESTVKLMFNLETTKKYTTKEEIREKINKIIKDIEKSYNSINNLRDNMKNTGILIENNTILSKNGKEELLCKLMEMESKRNLYLLRLHNIKSEILTYKL
ncbi:hypothetical protein EHP00_1187 [Ecytonucleospora hepatopenaei]|uniref:Uncharacterized protein n=1 Tax=Ecytonucleospora hepatopenaei TaxID=646526 RepID=A0A1W0E8B1_9MICR|nr:hypothetical protein EHP00_1187 [Ecytonucleospora hepatopenaei]